MTTDEAKQLIPFYIANTLNAEEKAELESMMSNAEMLKDEARFWEKARIAARIHAAYEAEGHLPSEQVVDYAERTISDPALKLRIEQHLQSCSECRGEYDLIVQTWTQPVQNNTKKQSLWERIEGIVSGLFAPMTSGQGTGILRPAYVLPVAATLIAGFFVIRYLATVPETGMLSQREISFVLEFQSQVRGADRDGENLPEMYLGKHTQTVNLTVCVPYDSLVSVRYIASLTDNKGNRHRVDGSFARVPGRHSNVDSVKLALDISRIALQDGVYTLYLNEDLSTLPPGTVPLPPEPYRFRVIRK